MNKDDILQTYWIKYLSHWRSQGKDVSHPPDEDSFWAWFATEQWDDDWDDED